MVKKRSKGANKGKIVTVKTKLKLKIPKFREIREERCKHLNEDKLPVMVLALSNSDYKLKRGMREWKYICHQTEGNACHANYMRGTILEPKQKTLKAMQKINDSWLNSGCGTWGTRLDEINKYRRQLKRLLDVDCDDSYKIFGEGIYPIDCDVKNIRKLCKDKIPDSLDYFLSEKDLFGMLNRWNLYILGKNSY